MLMRRLSSIALASLLAVSALVVSGCAKSAQQATPSEEPAQTAQEPPAEEPAATQEAEAAQPAEQAGKKYTIGISQSMEHGALDAARQGFMDALKEKEVDVEYDYVNAQGEKSNLKTISTRFVSNKVDMVLAIATDAVESIANETAEIPILFTAVTDPVEIKVVDTMEAPGRNISGTSDMNPIDKQIDLIKTLVPDVKTIGVMYTSSEANSKVQADIAIEYCKTLGIETTVVTAASVNDITATTQSLVGKVDAIYIPTDNSIASAMASVAIVAEKEKLPVFAADPTMTQQGGLATIGLNYYNLGYQTGLMAYKVLVEGEDISKMPVETLQTADFYLNQRTAEAIDVTFPQELIDQAVEIWTE